MALQQYIFVTNQNPEPHEDRYNGEPFLFMPGEAVAVPVDAAVHMLGYKVSDKTDTLSRLGKAFKYDKATGFSENTEGVRWLANFIFEEAEIRPKSALQQALAKSSGPSVEALEIV